LHKDLVEITNILAENNFPVMICNGWYVNSENAKAIFKAGIHEVSISIDYVDPEKHDRQRGKKGAFNRAIHALKILNENRYYPHQRVHMISVVMDNNLHEIEPLIQLSEDLGVTYLVTLYSQGRGKRNQKYSSQEIDTYLLGLKRKYGNFVSLTGYLSKFGNAVENGDSNYPCYAGKNLMNIDCQGDVSLCIDSLDQKIGNILNDDIFDLKDRLNQTQSNNRCSRCWTSCRGSIETLMYGDQRIRNLMDLYQMTKKVKTKN
jgi:MoaA/NifB/PqqE/SkfB family radical SAM enzyme